MKEIINDHLHLTKSGIWFEDIESLTGDEFNAICYKMIEEVKQP